MREKSQNVGDIEKEYAGINRYEGRKSDCIDPSGRKCVVKCVCMQVGVGGEDTESTRGTESFLISPTQFFGTKLFPLLISPSLLPNLLLPWRLTELHWMRMATC